MHSTRVSWLNIQINLNFRCIGCFQELFLITPRIQISNAFGKHNICSGGRRGGVPRIPDEPDCSLSTKASELLRDCKKRISKQDKQCHRVPWAWNLETQRGKSVSFQKEHSIDNKNCWSYPLSLIINKAMNGKKVGVNSLFSHIHKSALFPIFIVVVCLYHCIINKARSRKHIVYIHLSSTLNACNRCTLNSPSSISTLRSPEKLAWLEIF